MWRIFGHSLSISTMSPLINHGFSWGAEKRSQNLSPCSASGNPLSLGVGREIKLLPSLPLLWDPRRAWEKCEGKVEKQCGTTWWRKAAQEGDKGGMASSWGPASNRDQNSPSWVFKKQ